MNYKKAVKKIKKLVRESKNPFVEECVSVFESRGLDGDLFLEVHFAGVSKYEESFEYCVQFNGESCFLSEHDAQDVGIARYKHLKEILSLDSIDELIDITVPCLTRVSFKRFTCIFSPETLREGASWTDYLGCGQIHDLSAIQVAYLAQRDIRDFVERDKLIKKGHDNATEMLRGRIEELEGYIESMEEGGW